MKYLLGAVITGGVLYNYALFLAVLVAAIYGAVVAFSTHPWIFWGSVGVVIGFGVVTSIGLIKGWIE